MRAPDGDKQLTVDGKSTAKTLDSERTDLGIWKTAGVFNHANATENDGQRADLTFIPNSTPFITITRRTYILKNLKSDIQSVVVNIPTPSLLYGGFGE